MGFGRGKGYTPATVSTVVTFQVSTNVSTDLEAEDGTSVTLVTGEQP